MSDVKYVTRQNVKLPPIEKESVRKKTGTVKQTALEKYLALKDKVERMQFEVDKYVQESGFDEMKAELYTSLENGAAVEPGSIEAFLAEGRRCPRWKEEFEAIAGAAAVKAIIANTEPGKKMVIQMKRKKLDWEKK